ncbi:MAG: hypothetical protein HY787_06340 [Deltaproteobacteria bacterium]|nr:hypothetical protein [Deltaproteobacteria bacterium]
MKICSVLFLLLSFCVWPAWAGYGGDAVEVRIVTDEGRTLPIYPLTTGHRVHKVYAEAVKGDHYRIEIRNLLNRRIGVVIAVDGRNIISGGKSWLKNSERMYILEAYGWGSYAGWRTAQNRINRFYFTEVPDSYASAFGDESAMGVIVLAVYPEVRRFDPPGPHSQLSPFRPEAKEGQGSGRADKRQVLPPKSPALKDNKEKGIGRAEKALESAGTGFGRDEYSPSRIVAFEPEKQASETIYVKYEWRSTLCKLGVLECGQPPRRPSNRFWDHEGYAPPPPVSWRR